MTRQFFTSLVFIFALTLATPCNLIHSPILFPTYSVPLLTTRYFTFDFFLSHCTVFYFQFPLKWMNLQSFISNVYRNYLPCPPCPAPLPAAHYCTFEFPSLLHSCSHYSFNGNNFGASDSLSHPPCPFLASFLFQLSLDYFNFSFSFTTKYYFSYNYNHSAERS